MSGELVSVREEMIKLQGWIEALREVGEDYLIISIGVRGPNHDCSEGNAVATIRMGDDEATSEALYLPDAISLARGKVLRMRRTRSEKADGDAQVSS